MTDLLELVEKSDMEEIVVALYPLLKQMALQLVPSQRPSRRRT